MKRLLCCVLLLATFAAADCKARIAVGTYSESGHLLFLMSPDQQKWWDNGGARKYADLCLASSLKDADYLLVWSSDRTARTTVLKSEESDDQRLVGGATRTQGYGSTSLYIPAKNEKGETEWLATRTFYAKRGDIGSLLWSTYIREATKHSFENALKYLRAQEKR